MTRLIVEVRAQLVFNGRDEIRRFPGIIVRDPHACRLTINSGPINDHDDRVHRLGKVLRHTEYRFQRLARRFVVSVKWLCRHGVQNGARRLFRGGWWKVDGRRRRTIGSGVSVRIYARLHRVTSICRVRYRVRRYVHADRGRHATRRL